jgi:hypothetical protein
MYFLLYYGIQDNSAVEVPLTLFTFTHIAHVHFPLLRLKQ